MKIFGLVGQPGSGKDTAAEYIAKHYGIRHIASGDVLREYIKSNNLGGLDRENMHKVVTNLRRERGDAVLVDIALERVGTNDQVLISGLRNPSEAKAIVELGGYIIAITAPIGDRYARAKQRNREGDDIGLEEFTRLEQNENHGQVFNTSQLINGAEFRVSNDDGYGRFMNKLDRLMNQLGFEKY